MNFVLWNGDFKLLLVNQVCFHMNIIQSRSSLLCCGKLDDFELSSIGKDKLISTLGITVLPNKMQQASLYSLLANSILSMGTSLN